MNKHLKKCMTMLAILFLIVMSGTRGVPLAFAVSRTNENQEAEKTVTEYYKALMIAYLGDDSSVVEPYLDLSELQSQNVMNALECISFSQQYLMEEYGQEDIREDVPYEITFDSVEVKDNTCEVKISLRLLPHETDAPFLSGGEEVFHLKWLEGRWKISRHEWNGIDGFELFTDEVYQFDKEQRKKLLDDMMSWPKEGQDISEWNFEPEDECNLESGSNLITSVVPQDPLPGGIPIGNYNYNVSNGLNQPFK